ncbi:MAG TPA: sterol desaturase family protein [Pirellulaceae bacterium]|nr:sterol desaturase family protein [Pirellulaceae bacterium]
MWSYITSETGIRLGSAVGVLVVMALLELLTPRRPLTTNKPLRWMNNLGLVLLNTLVLRLLVSMSAAGVALFAQSRGWGLFNNVSISVWLAVVTSVVALDFAIYLQHVMFHAIPVLWRLHMVHHADLDFDVTTGLRFHTIEILLSFGVKCAVIVLLGASPLAVVVFEVLLNGTAMFNHSNVRLPGWLDRALRLVVVTPDMHRVHHSVIKRETNSNFGFNLPWWDYLLGTYRDQPANGHESMTIGLSQFRDERVGRLPWMLTLPFFGELGPYPINRNGEVPEPRVESGVRSSISPNVDEMPSQ